MAETELTVRIDDDLKVSGEVLFRRLGMDFSKAIDVFVRESVLRGGMPFEAGGGLCAPAEAVETEEEYYAELRRRAADMDAGRNCAVRELIEVEG